MSVLGLTPATLATGSVWGIGRGLWFGDQASTIAPRIDSLFMFIFWVSTFFFVLIVGLMTYFVIKYRRLPGVAPQRSASHNTPLELAWTFIPIFPMAIMFVWGFRDYMHMHVAPAGAEQIDLRAQRWSWQATYDNGANPTETARVADMDVPVIPVPAGRPIKLVMHSTDVIHSFWAPDFRVKMDVMPNRYTTTWFNAVPGATQFDENGQPLPYTDHYMFCTEYCGDQHSQMAAILRVMPAAEYDAAKAAMADIFEGRTPVEVGAILYNIKGCVACHATDSRRGTGPGWGGVWGSSRRVRLADGSVTDVVADENYVRESILVPAAKIVDGYPNQMVSYQGQLNDKELDALIAYIRSLGGGE